MKKRGEFNFSLLFAIIAGAAILVLAIYGASEWGKTFKQQSETEIAKSITVLTDPLQSGFAEAKSSRIEFRQETKIDNVCKDINLGRNELSVSVKTEGIGDQWDVKKTPISVENKYIFSDNSAGKVFYVFSKPFSMPFKIADLLIISADEYCFLDAPDEIQEEILNLNMKNVFIGSENCTENSKKVCFRYGDCDILVEGKCVGDCDSEYDYGFVEKSNKRLDYAGSLLYATIFSDKETYDCNVKRLLYRLSIVSDIFYNKADLMNTQGCNTNLGLDMALLKLASTEATSEDLEDLYILGKELNKKNSRERCSLW